MQSDIAAHNMTTGMPAMHCRHGRPDKLCDDYNRSACVVTRKSAMRGACSKIAKWKPIFGKDYAPTMSKHGRMPCDRKVR